MRKRNSRLKNAVMLDSDDAHNVTSSSTMRSDSRLQDFVKHSLLDQALDALYEKRGLTREKALELIVEELSSSLKYEFVGINCVTLLNLCVNSIKRGSSKEISLACHVIGLVAMTSGSSDNAQEILKEAISPISQAVRSRSDSSKISSLLQCLAVITFIGGDHPEETERSMQIMWEAVNPKSGNNVVASKPSPAVITAMVSAWGFLLTTVDKWSLGLKQCQEFTAYLSSLLDKDDRSVRIAAGEALAVLFEIGEFERFSTEAKVSEDDTNKPRKPRDGYAHLQGLTGKVLNQIKDLATEAGGKGSSKKDLNCQRTLFHDVLEFLEDGYFPETSTKIGGEQLTTSSWSQLIQLNFLKHFLGGGFVKHMQDNEFLHEVFSFSPGRKFNVPKDKFMCNKLADKDYVKVGSPQPTTSSRTQKRMFKSPNSILSKARTRHLNKQRMSHQDHKIGHFAVGYEE